MGTAKPSHTTGGSWIRRFWHSLDQAQLKARALPSLALWVALVVLRQQIIADMGIGMSEALTSGLCMGWGYDLLAVLFAALAGRALFGLLCIPARLTWASAAIFIWLATLANAVHFHFFKIPLDWWIVQLHWQDLLLVKGSAAQLSMRASYFVSGACLVLSLCLLLAQERLARRLGAVTQPVHGFWRTRRVATKRALALAAVVFVWWRLPFWLNLHQGSTIVKDHIVRVWLQQNFGTNVFAGAGTEWGDELTEGMSEEDRRCPSCVLAAYRDFEPRGAGDTTRSATYDSVPTIGAETKWPLWRNIAPLPDETLALRRRLGLPDNGPINIFVLFLESTRAYEIDHPDLGPQIFPRLRRVLDEHAVYFTQAYSSSFKAGQTVRGQFSTLCSMLPNMLGAAVYIAHTTTSMRCIQGLLKDNGYTTVWMNSYKSTFHQKRLFESLHGTELFFDEEYYESHGVTQRIGEWGLADKPFLQQSLRLFGELHAEKQAPIFANVLTISTHHPQTVIPEGPLSAALLEATSGDEPYRGYLSRLRYADEAVGDFFDAFFQSPIADSTVVVLLGDHSTPHVPFHPLQRHQKEEAMFRIPIALITKAMPKAERIGVPVHQVDVAPTLARLAGARGDITWVGRGLFEGGSPWVYVRRGTVEYRTRERACYAVGQNRMLRCFRTSDDIDPMFAAQLEEIPEDPAETERFTRVVKANMNAIVTNRIMPVSGNGSGSTNGSTTTSPAGEQPALSAGPSGHE